MPTVPTAQRSLPTWASRTDSHRTTDTSRWHSSHSFAQPSEVLAVHNVACDLKILHTRFPHFHTPFASRVPHSLHGEALLLSASCEKSLLLCHLSKRECTFSPRQYFQNNCHALKIFFHALKKFFQGMEKVFQALEKFFPSTRVTFPDFTRHFLLALSETVDSLLRAILIQ